MHSFIKAKQAIGTALRLYTILIELLPQTARRSVIDLDCGAGHWLSVFQTEGFEITGVDGGNVPPQLLVIPPEHYVVLDLTEPKPIAKSGTRYTLAMSSEVAEHLPEIRLMRLLRP